MPSQPNRYMKRYLYCSAHPRLERHAKLCLISESNLFVIVALEIWVIYGIFGLTFLEVSPWHRAPGPTGDDGKLTVKDLGSRPDFFLILIRVSPAADLRG